MGANFDHYIERFHLSPEGREVLLNNIQNLAQDAIGRGIPFPFRPEFFWNGDLEKMDEAEREKLLDWLFEEGSAAAKMATQDYDYAEAPDTVEDLEEEVLMIQLAAAVYRVLQLQGRFHLSVVLNDEQGRPFRMFPDGRVEYIKQAKKAGK